MKSFVLSTMERQYWGVSILNSWSLYMAYHIPKTKVPPWFAVHVGSVVETVGAKIQPFFHSNTIFFNIFFITFIITRLCHCLFFKLILPSHRYFSKFNPFLTQIGH